MNSHFIRIASSSVGTTRTHDFEIQFIYPIVLDGQYECALVNASIYNTYYNVSSAIGNNKLSYTPDNGAQWNTVTFPDGCYNLEDLNSLLYADMVSNGVEDADADGVADIVLTPNYNTSKVEVTINNPNCEVDLDGSTAGAASTIYLLFGFTAAQASSPITTTTSGANIANIENDVNTLVINTSLLANGNSYDSGSKTNSLWSFTPNAPPGSEMVVIPAERVYIPMNNAKTIERIRMTITDQSGNLVDFNGQDITYQIHIREIR